MIGQLVRVRYEIRSEASSGPIFRRLRAYDRVRGTDVLLKMADMPYSAEPEFTARLREVAARLSQVVHPGLERVYECDEHEGYTFVVCELFEGRTLADRIAKLAPFSAAMAVSLVRSILEALEALHAAGIVHGDLRPDNVLVAADGAVKLVDAALWETYSGSKTAGAVALPVMAPYLAPEITAGSMPHPGSDVYALGVILFQLLTGKAPFAGDTPGALAIKHSTAPVPQVRTFNPNVPSVLDEITRKALAKSPADRYPDARAMLSDIRAVQEAIRFGRTLSWPIEAGQIGAGELAPARAAVTADQAKKVSSAPRTEASDFVDDRLPRFLAWLVYIGVVVLVVLVASFAAFSLNKPKLTAMPNVIGMSVADAEARLRDARLSSRVAARATSEQYQENEVMATNPPPGQRVREGALVDLTVSQGSRLVPVPNLKGKSLEEARRILADLRLDVEQPVEEVPSDSVPEGHVVSQTPASGSIERGSTVRLQVSKGPERPVRRDRNRRDIYSLTITIPQGTVPVTVRVDMEDATGNRTIDESLRQPGESYALESEGVGGEAIFRIYFDGELVSTLRKQADD